MKPKAIPFKIRSILSLKSGWESACVGQHALQEMCVCTGNSMQTWYQIHGSVVSSPRQGALTRMFGSR
eukprot:1160021-Pelagomonas_calceolata.AAC.4